MTHALRIMVPRRAGVRVLNSLVQNGFIRSKNIILPTSITSLQKNFMSHDVKNKSQPKKLFTDARSHSRVRGLKEKQERYDDVVMHFILVFSILCNCIYITIIFVHLFMPM